MTNLEQAVKDFIFHCQYEKNLSKKTISAYTNDLSQFFLFLREEKFDGAVDEVNKHHLRSFLKIISEKSKPKTVKRKFATLKSFFGFLELEELVSVNPFRKMRINILLDKRLPEVMTLLEVRSLFEHLYKRKALILEPPTPIDYLVIRDIAILEMLFATGIRVAELAGLKQQDVDLETGVVRVFGKGRKERIIPLCNNSVLEALRQYRSVVKGLRKGRSFFLNRSGGNITDQSIRIIVQKHVRNAGLAKKITPHTFRHTVATLLLENGVDIRNIQTLLGHSNISTTALYVKVNQMAQRELIKRLHPRELFE